MRSNLWSLCYLYLVFRRNGPLIKSIETLFWRVSHLLGGASVICAVRLGLSLSQQNHSIEHAGDFWRFESSATVCARRLHSEWLHKPFWVSIGLALADVRSKSKGWNCVAKMAIRTCLRRKEGTAYSVALFPRNVLVHLFKVLLTCHI